MSRTKFTVLSSYRLGMGYFAKSKRHRIKIVKRKAQHSLKIKNQYADQMQYTHLKQSAKRKYYKTYQPSMIIFGLNIDYYRDQLFKPRDLLKDSMRKRLQQSLRKLKNGQLSDYRLRKKPLVLSDLFTAIYKKIRRRGNLKPFIGHRENGVLYKRELAYWE